MNYTQATYAVKNNGKYAYWSGLNNGVAGSYLFGNPILLYAPGSPSGTTYSPTSQDQAATNWAISDHPPH